MKDIKGYEGVYAVTEDGRVWSYGRSWTVPGFRGRIVQRKGKWIKPYIDRYGYAVVCLTKNSKGKAHKVHRLVAETYIENRNNLPQVNHKSGVKTDNRRANLEWCTNRENILHAYRTGLFG